MMGSVGYQEPDIAANRHRWEQDGYSRACLHPQLGSHGRAGNTAGGEASLGRHGGCEGLGSAEILSESPSCGFCTQKLWELLERLLEGEADAQGLTLCCIAPHWAHSSRVSVAGVYFYRCDTAPPVNTSCRVKFLCG